MHLHNNDGICSEHLKYTYKDKNGKISSNRSNMG